MILRGLLNTTCARRAERERAGRGLGRDGRKLLVGRILRDLRANRPAGWQDEGVNATSGLSDGVDLFEGNLNLSYAAPKGACTRCLTATRKPSTHLTGATS